MILRPPRVPLLAAILVAFFCAQSSATCPPEKGIALQVLGSGGPIADDGRASTAYLIWIDGRSRVLIDAGGGSFLRFGEAGGAFADLDFIGLSHFHTDHSADFPALLKSGNFSGRERELPVAGPSGTTRFPGLGDFLVAMLDREKGAYAYLGGYLDGTGRLAKLVPIEVDVGKDTPVRVLNAADRGIEITAIGVPHGIVPAVAFRVSVGVTSIVFSGDQTMSNPAFTEFANGATVLVVHLAIPEDAGQAAKRLHAAPSRLAEIAASIEPQTLVVSHFMARSLRHPANGTRILQRRYSGDVILAEDLACLPVMTP